MRKVLSRARVWIAIPLLAGGLFAFQSQAVANNGHHHHNTNQQSHVEDQSKTEDHSKVEDHSKTCNTTEEQHESPQAQAHEHEHGCD
jgi:uncharacterized protein HemX